MSGSMDINLTCDRKNGLLRVAVWQGKIVRDLYLDCIKSPDLTGAIVGGKVVRVMTGERSAFVECGLENKVYVTSAHKLKTGQYLMLKLTSPARQGKAWSGVMVEMEEGVDAIGLIHEAPNAWQRALADLKQSRIKSITFAQREDYAACQDWMGAGHTKPLMHDGKTVLHPELDELIDQLCATHIPLPHDGAIVIEATEALTAIDVNGPENTHPLTLNLLAVKEAARQIRLRNLGGIIVIDALKMTQRTDKAKILHALQKAVADDPAGVQVFGLTKLGLIELTRGRRGATLHDVVVLAGHGG